MRCQIMTDNPDTLQPKAGRTRRNVLKTTGSLGILAAGLGTGTAAAAEDSNDLDSVDVALDPEYLEVTDPTPSGPTPQAISFSGTVTPGTYNLHGSFIWDQGQEVQINVDWSPGYEDLLVGVFDRNRGEGGAVTVSGGVAEVTATVGWYSDDWAVFIGAPEANTEAVSYSGNAQD